MSQWQSELAGSAFLTQTKQVSAQTYLSMKQQVVQNLSHPSRQPECLSGSAYDERLMLPQHVQDHDLTAISGVYTYKLLLAFTFGQYTAALENVAQAQPCLIALSPPLVPIFHFYAALTYLQLAPTQSESEQATTLAQAETHQTALYQSAQTAPINYLHQWQLVEAERQRVLGQTAAALDYYDRAIASAKANQFLSDQALANELAAKFYLDWDKPAIARD
ncbi:MAG: hypothetical protein KME35_13155 [Aphanocapsa sp. GSE-SYN-MK-11-07L]|nr:hypothetical protein [Aphanocapsa sp. GSE-SYN-MK-11-07L]